MCECSLLAVSLWHPLWTSVCYFFSFSDTATPEIYTLSLHDALPISGGLGGPIGVPPAPHGDHRPDRLDDTEGRSEEHTSELQSLRHLVCRLLLEKKKRI